MINLENLLGNQNLSEKERKNVKEWINSLPEPEVDAVLTVINNYKGEDFAVYVTGSSLDKQEHDDIDLIWADERFADDSDFAHYIDLPEGYNIQSTEFETSYTDHNDAEAFVISPEGSKIHICIPKLYETVSWAGAIQRFGQPASPRDYENTEEYKSNKIMPLYRSKTL